MSGFNLSEWALKHRSITVYLMILAVLAGLASYYRLGRSEDPSFIIKTMVVQAQWPGATTEETLKQVTERLERTLQELGTGEAIVTVMSEKGAPTPVAWTRLRAPQGLMSPTPDAQIDAAVAASVLLPRYGTPIDRESAREILTAKMNAVAEAEAAAAAAKAQAESDKELAKKQAAAQKAEAAAEKERQKEYDRLMKASGGSLLAGSG